MESPLYLAGSIHLLRSTDEIAPEFFEVLESVEQVAFEVEPSGGSRMRAAAAMLNKGRAPRGQRLKDLIPPELDQQLQQKLGDSSRYTLIQPFQPWFAAMTLTLEELTRLGADPQKGLDATLYQRAVDSGKQTHSLETALEQIQMLSSFSPGQQARFLEYTLETLDRTGASYDRIVQAWNTGNESVLSEYFQPKGNDFDAVIEKIIFERNRSWLPGIIEMGKSGEATLVVVGVGHLVGPGSIVDLLRNQGYTTRRLEQ